MRTSTAQRRLTFTPVSQTVNINKHTYIARARTHHKWLRCLQRVIMELLYKWYFVLRVISQQTYDFDIMLTLNCGIEHDRQHPNNTSTLRLFQKEEAPLLQSFWNDLVDLQMMQRQANIFYHRYLHLLIYRATLFIHHAPAWIFEAINQYS